MAGCRPTADGQRCRSDGAEVTGCRPAAYKDVASTAPQRLTLNRWDVAVTGWLPTPRGLTSVELGKSTIFALRSRKKRKRDEENVSTFPEKEAKQARIQRAYSLCRWQKGIGQKACPRAQALDGQRSAPQAISLILLSPRAYRSDKAQWLRIPLLGFLQEAPRRGVCLLLLPLQARDRPANRLP